MNAMWKSTKRILESSLNPGLYQVWIKPLSAEIDGEDMTVIAPNPFVASWVKERLVDAIAEAATQVLGYRPRLSVRASLEQKPKAVMSVQHTAQGMEQLHLPVRQDPVSTRDIFRFSFDDFVVGPCNELAYAASQDICRKHYAADQLYLCSSPGLGKTHLLQAIGASMASNANIAKKRVVYLTAEEFASRMVMALKTREIERFKSYFRENVDMLLLEDIHFFQGKLKLQDELLNTINALNSRGCKVVFTSSFLPKELNGVDSQLASRFNSGFLAVIDKPDMPTRLHILNRKALSLQIQVPAEVAQLMAGRITSDIRQLESCLHNLILKARLLKRNITAELAMQVLKNYDIEPDNLSMNQIVQFICNTYDTSVEQLRSKSRKRQFVLARNTAFFLARKHTELSLQDIGHQFNRRHSTVIKGITTIERHMSMKTPLGREIEKTIDKLTV